MNRLRWIMAGLMIVVVLVTALTSIVQAREPNRQDIGYIVSYQTEIIFPAAIRFSVTVDAILDNIESARLSVFQRGAVLSTIELDFERHVYNATDLSTQLVYMWSLNSADAPVPFEPISYRWEIVTRDEFTSTIDDDLLFEDRARGSWQTAGRPPVVLHWSDWGLAGETLRNELVPVNDLLEDHTGRTLAFEFVVYESNTSYCQEVQDPGSETTRQIVISRQDGTEFPCSKADFEALYADSGILFAERPHAGFTALKDILTQQMVQNAYAPFWANTFVPAWFQAGIGFVYRQRTALDMLSAARDAARVESLLPIETLSAALPVDAPYQQQQLWEAQSYLLVLYLMDQYGPDIVFTLARTAGDGDFEGTLYALTGGDGRALWDNWYHWLLWEGADAAMMWTPYNTSPGM